MGKASVCILGSRGRSCTTTGPFLPAGACQGVAGGYANCTWIALVSRGSDARRPGWACQKCAAATLRPARSHASMCMLAGMAHIVLQLLTSWMWAIVTWSAFSSLRVHFQPSGSRVARHVPVVGGVTWMEGTCVRTEHSWVVQQSLLPSHAWQAAHACC